MDDKDIEEIKRLVEQKPPVRNRPPIPKAEQMRRKAEREKQRRRRQIIMNTAAVAVIALFIFGIILLFKSCSTDHSIVGTWDYDTVTIYRFDKNGKGELILPNSTFAFTYKIKDDTLTIDFESENATDSTYTFSVTDDKLTLTAESSDAVYVLTKKTEP